MAVVPPVPPPVAEVPITQAAPQITAKFASPRPTAAAEPAKPKPLPQKARTGAAPKPAEKAERKQTAPPLGKQVPPPARQEGAASASAPQVKSGSLKLLAVSGETVWVTANDKTTVTAQVGEDLPAGMGKVTAVFPNGARFEKNGKKFDLTVE